MKNILTIILIASYWLCPAQSFVDEIIDCSNHRTENILKSEFSEEVFKSDFKFLKDKVKVEVYHRPSNSFKTISLSEFRKTNFALKQIWIVYEIKSCDLILTTIEIPFNLKCDENWKSGGLQEIIKPYKKVIENNIEINLIQAIKIAKKRGLLRVFFWGIDYENKKLVWTLKSKLKNNKSNVIKINSENGKILSRFIEVAID